MQGRGQKQERIIFAKFRIAFFQNSPPVFLIHLKTKKLIFKTVIVARKVND